MTTRTRVRVGKRKERKGGHIWGQKTCWDPLVVRPYGKKVKWYTPNPAAEKFPEKLGLAERKTEEVLLRSSKWATGGTFVGKEKSGNGRSVFPWTSLLAN